MSDERTFANGFFFKKRPNAPSFVEGNLSIKVKDALETLRDNVNDAGYVNIVIKVSKGGAFYCEIDNYDPKKAYKKKQYEPKPKTKKEKNDAEDEDIPF
jgi:hypothetical protein